MVGGARKIRQILSVFPMTTPLSYKDAGVDIDAGDALVERIKPLARKTMREGVLAGIGGFGALFEVPKRYRGAGAGERHRWRGHQAQAGL